MTKMEEMLSSKRALMQSMQDALNADKLDEAKEFKDKITALNDKISMQQIIDDESKPAPVPANSAVEDKNASFIRAAIKKFTNRKLTDMENALLLPTATSTNGANGESYILPKDIQTIVTRKIRDYGSMRDVLGYIQTTALSGSFPVEGFDSLSGLIDFTDGTDGTDDTSISFNNVSFSLAEKGALIKLSNTLLKMTDEDLVSYVADIFAKKAIVTENTLAIDALKTGKTVKTLADWKALKSSLNKDIDPAALFGAVIATNQDGFDILDSALDSYGRPVLQVNPTEPTKRTFMGIPVRVYSNALMPSSAATKSAEGYAPIFYGNLSEGAKFIDLGSTEFAADASAGFMSNTTIARLIEHIAVAQVDSSDKCYIYGQLKVAEKLAS